MISTRYSVLLASLVLWISAGNTPGVAQEPYQPRIAPASGDAELALKGFQLPEGITGRLLAAEPLLANPVAFHVAHDGKLYVCETFRQEAGVEDNRGHMNWLHNDLRLESVEERLAMFRRYLGGDVDKWSREHDRIRLLVDTDGDGRFDRDTVFADGFNDILDGTGAGVIEVNGSVYYTCIPKLWRFQDTNKDGAADERQILHHGYGVRVAFRGHDLHGLTVGPDGRLYFSLGDRGYNVITAEGTRLKRPDTGAVFRCDLDGTHLEVFAYGLRNPQELAFDDHGNLFTGDNNSDSGDQARWVYVVQDGDTGWRMYYQYLDDRGPWNRERMWYPWQADDATKAVQPAYIIPPVANLGDGPSGLTFYPGVGLSDRYQSHFFMADFRGTPGNSGIRSFAVKPRGATFDLTDSHQFIWSILATDVDFAPDGSLYVSDWVNGWQGEGKGRIYRFADEQHLQQAVDARVADRLSGGFSDTDVSELTGLLSHVDRRVRQGAQFELVRRDAREQLYRTAATSQNAVARRHALWGIWQLGLRSSEDAADALRVLSDFINDVDPENSVQVVRIITDVVLRHGITPVLTTELRDQLRSALTANTLEDNVRLAGFSAAALGTVGYSTDSHALLSLLDRSNNQDPVVRHQASQGLVQLAERNPGLLASLKDHTGAAGRLGLVLAMRRLQDPALALLLTDADPDVALEAARAINDELIEGAPQWQLAMLPFDGGTSDAMVRRIMNACYRLGTAKCAQQVARVCVDDRRSESIRLVAAGLLNSWNQPQPLDTVTGNWRPVADVREVEGLLEAVEPYLPGMLAGPEKVREAAIQIASTLGMTELVPTLKNLLNNSMTPEALRVSSFRALMKLSETSVADRLLESSLRDSSEQLRLAALELLSASRPDESIPLLAEVMKTGSIKAQQKAIQLLAGIRNDQTETLLLNAFTRLKQSRLPNELVLDLLEAAGAMGTMELKAAVEEFRRTQQETGIVLAQWSECLSGGDASRGQEIFSGRSSASCRRCHKVDRIGGEVGPDLSGIGLEKDRNYLLEAIVDPNAKIAKGFETVILVTIEGRIHSGVLRHEDEQMVQLMTAEGATITVSKDNIDERATGQSGMPADIARNLTRAEIRDLVEYLTTLRAAAANTDSQDSQ